MRVTSCEPLRARARPAASRARILARARAINCEPCWTRACAFCRSRGNRSRRLTAVRRAGSLAATALEPSRPADASPAVQHHSTASNRQDTSLSIALCRSRRSQPRRRTTCARQSGLADLSPARQEPPPDLLTSSPLPRCPSGSEACETRETTGSAATRQAPGCRQPSQTSSHRPPTHLDMKTRNRQASTQEGGRSRGLPQRVKLQGSSTLEDVKSQASPPPASLDVIKSVIALRQEARQSL